MRLTSHMIRFALATCVRNPLHYLKARKELVKFKNASGINPRLKIEEISVTLDLDPRIDY